jgi:AcrR family transcriptional regulator
MATASSLPGNNHATGRSRISTRSRMQDVRAEGNAALQTRIALVVAAKHEFAKHGYDQTGLRQIAAVAGADKRLITRHFGSKEHLFEATLSSSIRRCGLDYDQEHLDQRFAHHVLGAELIEAARLEFIALCIQSRASPIGKRLVRANAKQQIEQLARQFGGEDSAVRAALFLVICFGTALVREIFQIEELNNLNLEKATCLMTPVLQLLINPHGSAGPRVHG